MEKNNYLEDSYNDLLGYGKENYCKNTNYYNFDTALLSIDRSYESDQDHL